MRERKERGEMDNRNSIGEYCVFERTTGRKRRRERKERKRKERNGVLAK